MTDALFRSCDLKTRKSYVALVESVRDNGGMVHVFSALHVSGKTRKFEKLKNVVTCVVTILELLIIVQILFLFVHFSFNVVLYKSQLSKQTQTVYTNFF